MVLQSSFFIVLVVLVFGFWVTLSVAAEAELNTIYSKDPPVLLKPDWVQKLTGNLYFLSAPDEVTAGWTRGFFDMNQPACRPLPQ
jgi:hypothetical protein